MHTSQIIISTRQIFSSLPRRDLHQCLSSEALLVFLITLKHKNKTKIVQLSQIIFFPRDSLSKRFSTIRIPYNISCLDKISSDGHKRCLLSSLNVNPYNSNRIYTIINSIITVATVSALSSVNTPFLNLSIALRFDVRHYD